MLDLTVKTLRYMDAAAAAVAANGAVLPVPPGAVAPDYAAALADAASVDPGTESTDAQKAAIAVADANVAKLLDAVPMAQRPTAPATTSANVKNDGRPSLALTKTLFTRAAAAQPWSLAQVRAAEVEAACAVDGVSPTAAQAADIAAATANFGPPVDTSISMRQDPSPTPVVSATGGVTLTAVQIAQINAMWANLHGSLRAAGIVPS